MKDAKGHGSNPRGGGGAPAMPIPGHPYHTKTNDELRYIAKDASEAAQNMRGVSPQAEGKYLDQVNDASTVLGYRARGGKDLSKGPAADVAAKHGIGGPAVGRGPTMTRDMAIGVGQDAGNKSMRAAGRTAWNEDDHAAATEAMTRAQRLIPRG